jgi:uncharacterized cupin superfamily protein
MSTLPATTHTPIETDIWEPFSVDGMPMGEMHWLQRPASIDETPQAAIWRVLPGSAPEEFPYEFHGNELMHVLEGVLEVAVEGGETVTIRAGEVAYFPAGTRSIWRLTTPLRKLFMVG